MAIAPDSNSPGSEAIPFKTVNTDEVQAKALSQVSCQSIKKWLILGSAAGLGQKCTNILNPPVFGIIYYETFNPGNLPPVNNGAS
jgi:hypothetical protein